MAAGAAAQSVDLTAEGPEEALDIRGGDATTATIDVTLQADQFFCFEESDLVVDATAEATDGVQAAVDPAEIVFTLPMGIHDSGLEGQEAYEESQSVTVELDAPSGTEQDFSTQITFEANFPGADPDECGADAFPSASDIAPINVNVQADAEPSNDDGASDDGDGGDDANGENPDDENGAPLPAWVVPGALTLAVAIRRRT